MTKADLKKKLMELGLPERQADRGAIWAVAYVKSRIERDYLIQGLSYCYNNFPYRYDFELCGTGINK